MAVEQQTDSYPNKARFWRRPVFWSMLFQGLLLLGVIAVGYLLISNMLQNLEQRGISTGFEFLGGESGFRVVQSLIEYDETHTFGRTFLVGLLNTLLVSGLGIIFATIIGFTMGAAHFSSNWLITKLATVYIETFRNVPLLLQIMFWYFAVLQPLPGPRQSLALGELFFLNNRGFYLPAPVLEEGLWVVLVMLLVAMYMVVNLKRWAQHRQELTGEQFHTFYVSLTVLIGLPLLAFLLMGMPLSLDYPTLIPEEFNFKGGMTIIPELAALLIALSIYTGTFIAEAVRSGTLAVSPGQTEAAYALGLRPALTLRLVIIPQALRMIIPQLTSQYLNLTKNSSLATAIGYPDLVHVFAGTTLSQTGQAVEVITMTMAVYLTISLLTTLFINWYGKQKQRVERKP